MQFAGIFQKFQFFRYIHTDTSLLKIEKRRRGERRREKGEGNPISPAGGAACVKTIFLLYISKKNVSLCL